MKTKPVTILLLHRLQPFRSASQFLKQSSEKNAKSTKIESTVNGRPAIVFLFDPLTGSVDIIKFVPGTVLLEIWSILLRHLRLHT